jgi:hypothetical protein
VADDARDRCVVANVSADARYTVALARAHVVVGAGLLLGSVVVAAAAPWSPTLLRAGFLIASVGVLAREVEAVY